MSLGAVVFDLDDTLIVEAEIAHESMRQIAALIDEVNPEQVADVLFESAREVWRSGPYLQPCLELGIASWEGLWSNFEGNHPSLDGLRDWAQGYREAAWREGLDRLGIDDPSLAERAAITFAETQRIGHRPIEGAQSLVRSLVGQSRLGLLTNGLSDIQRHKLLRSGLTDCFDAIVISGELGIGKPDSRAFSNVLERLDVSAGAALMIGDSWERDVRGALGAGMKVIWISGGRTPPEDEAGVTVVTGVTVVSRIDEVPACLEIMQSTPSPLRSLGVPKLCGEVSIWTE
jgi:phosphoserine phosphatase